MSIVVRMVSRFAILGLLAGTVAMVMFMPSKEQIGSAVNQVSGWFKPGVSQPVERHGLGPAKQRWMEQLKQAQSERARNRQQSAGESQTRRQPVAGFGETS